MTFTLQPDWRDDIRGATVSNRMRDGGYAMASVDKGALDSEGRPVNAPEPTSMPLVNGDGRVKAIDTNTAEAPNALDISNAKSAVNNWLRVVAYQFQVAVKPFVNQVTMTKLEEAFQENLKKLIEANTKHVAQMYEGIIELRVRETVDQRAKNMADLTIMQERSRHKQEMYDVRAGIDSLVAREKNAIRQQYIGFRERMRDEVISEVREELTDKLEELFDDMEE